MSDEQFKSRVARQQARGVEAEALGINLEFGPFGYCTEKLPDAAREPHYRTAVRVNAGLREIVCFPRQGITRSERAALLIAVNEALDVMEVAGLGPDQSGRDCPEPTFFTMHLTPLDPADPASKEGWSRILAERAA